MYNSIPKRLAALRNLMETNAIEACIIPTSDSHQGEYVSSHFKFRKYLSGFTGSAGTLVVGKDKAGLWTDSRYYLQAEQELRGSGIDLFKTTLPETPCIPEWIAEMNYRSAGIDGEVFAAREVLKMIQVFNKHGVRLVDDFKPYTRVWPDRPDLPDSPFYVFPVGYAGKSVKEKLSELRAELSCQGADYLPVSGLDDIAWLFNLRGSDVDFNPVGLAFALIGPDIANLYTDKNKIDESTLAYLKENNIQLRDYSALYADLSKLPTGSRVFTDTARINYFIYKHIPSNCRRVEGTAPTTALKSIKNPVEIAGFRTAMQKEGVALVRFWRWFEAALEQGKELYETDLVRKMSEFRLEQDHCKGDSFHSIISYNEHGAIVHYSPSESTKARILPDGYLLVDTGGQYLEGTTDITRTFSLYRGATPEEFKQDYARILKGNIALSECIFPTHTRGSQLDIMARQFLWKDLLQYGHGTCHGIGHFLNVHEGPQSIRMEENPELIKAGMVMSNEPGIYRTGKYGLRIENMMLVIEKGESEFGQFLGFETLSLCPLELKAIEKKYYTGQEIDWINAYHRFVYNRLSAFLSEEEKAWLALKTKEI